MSKYVAFNATNNTLDIGGTPVNVGTPQSVSIGTYNPKDSRITPGSNNKKHTHYMRIVFGGDARGAGNASSDYASLQAMISNAIPPEQTKDFQVSVLNEKLGGVSGRTGLELALAADVESNAGSSVGGDIVLNATTGTLYIFGTEIDVGNLPGVSTGQYNNKDFATRRRDAISKILVSEGLYAFDDINVLAPYNQSGALSLLAPTQAELTALPDGPRSDAQQKLIDATLARLTEQADTIIAQTPGASKSGLDQLREVLGRVGNLDPETYQKTVDRYVELDRGMEDDPFKQFMILEYGNGIPSLDSISGAIPTELSGLVEVREFDEKAGGRLLPPGVEPRKGLEILTKMDYIVIHEAGEPSKNGFDYSRIPGLDSIIRFIQRFRGNSE